MSVFLILIWALWFAYDDWLAKITTLDAIGAVPIGLWIAGSAPLWIFLFAAFIWVRVND